MITQDALLRRTRGRAAEAADPSHPVWRMGFRPFFLLAGVAAAAMVPLRVLALFEGIPLRAVFVDPFWHATEMIFGFAAAVVAGFLLTAVPKWTDTAPHSGRVLKGMAGLWLAGRIAPFLSGILPPWAIALLQLAFLPSLLWAVGAPILSTRNQRNYPVVGALAAMILAQIAASSGALGLGAGPSMTAAYVGVDAVALLMVLIGGRVLPPFTRNGLSRAGVEHSPRPGGWVDTASVAAAGGVILVEAAPAPGAVKAGVAGITALLVLARLVGWGGSRTLRIPLLWVLHLGYLWVGVGYALKAAAFLAPAVLDPKVALHALTAGAMGTLILGMTTRVGLGHTGRPLDAPPGIPLAYVLVVLGGLVRVGVHLVAPDLAVYGWAAAATLWAGAWLIFLYVYIPILLGPRADGAAG